MGVAMKTIVLAIVALIFATTAFAQGQYQIRSGDRLAVEVLEDPSLNRSLLVLPEQSRCERCERCDFCWFAWTSEPFCIVPIHEAQRAVAAFSSCLDVD